MSDKRKHIRFNIFLDAMAHVGGAIKKLKINNFSKDGIGILSQETFNEGEDVEIEFMIPGDNIPIILEGEIAWASDPTVPGSRHASGVKLKQKSDAQRSRLLGYIYKKWLNSPEEKGKAKETMEEK